MCIVRKKKLKTTLIQKDVLSYQLAKGTKTSTVHVSRIINGKVEGSMQWWRKAAEFLGVKLSEIIED